MDAARQDVAVLVAPPRVAPHKLVTALQMQRGGILGVLHLLVVCVVVELGLWLRLPVLVAEIDEALLGGGER